MRTVLAIILLYVSAWAQMPMGGITASGAAPAATFTVVNTASGTTSGVGVATLDTAGFSSTSGNTLLAFVRQGTAASPTGVKNAAGTSFTLIGSCVNDAGGGTTMCAYKLVNITGNASDKCTLDTGTTAAFTALTCIEVHSTGSAPAVDIGPASNGPNSGATSTSASFTTTTASEIIFAAATFYSVSGTFNSSTIAGSAGSAPTDDGNHMLGTSYRTVSSIQTTQTAAITYSSSNSNIAMAVSLK